MSYILNALKKADEQRRRGKVPSLANAPIGEPKPKAPRRFGWALLTVCVVIGAVAAVAVWWIRMPWRISSKGLSASQNMVAKLQEPAPKPEKKTPPKAVPKVAQKPVPKVKAAPALQPPPEEPPEVVAEAAPEAPRFAARSPRDFQRAFGRRGKGRGPSRRSGRLARSESEPAELPVAPQPKPAPVTPPPPAQTTTSEAPAPTVTEEASTAATTDSEAKAKAGRELTAQLSSAAPEQQVAKGVPEWHDLPLEIRKAIPTMKFSMLIYSDKPADRMLSINGDIFHEGAEVDADLTLVEITPNGGIFRYKSTTFYKGVF